MIQMKNIRIFIRSRLAMVIACLSTVFVPLCASDPDMKVADALYNDGNYSQAAEAYLSVAEVDGVSPGLYYNIANSFAQTGDMGKAILYYSRAKRLDPSNKEIRNNLDYFTSKVEDSNRAELRGKKISVSPDPESFFQTCNRMIAADVSSNFWAVLSAVCFILFLGGVAVYLFCSGILLRKIGFFGGICVFLLSVIFLVFAFMGAGYHDSHDKAVLMSYKTPLLLEPSSDSKPSSNQLCQGTVFDIIAEESGIDGSPAWYKVRLNSDIEGWIRASEITAI